MKFSIMHCGYCTKNTLHLHYYEDSLWYRIFMNVFSCDYKGSREITECAACKEANYE